MKPRSLRIMRITLVVMLGASLFFAACSAEELCTDGVCVSDADSEDPRTVEVNSNGETDGDFWDNVNNVDVEENNDDTVNPKERREQAQAILNRMKKRSSERKQNIENNSKKPNDVQANKKANNNKVEVTPEMERYFQDLIDSGGDHARLSVLSDLLSGTKTSMPVKDMPTIILTDKETADRHLRESWGANNEEKLKRDRKEEVDSLDRLRSIFMESLSSVDEGGNSSEAGGDQGTAVNLANMLEELFGGDEAEFDGDNGIRDHTQKGFGAEQNPCPNFEDSGKTGFPAPRMLHGYTDKNGVEPEEDTNMLSTNGCSMLGDKKDADDFGLWKCCNRHDICYGLCGSSLRFCERSFSTCMSSTCDAVDIGHDEKSIIANQEACRAKKRVRFRVPFFPLVSASNGDMVYNYILTVSPSLFSFSLFPSFSFSHFFASLLRNIVLFLVYLVQKCIPLNTMVHAPV